MLYSPVRIALFGLAALGGLSATGFSQSVTRLVLVNTSTQKDIRALTNGDTIVLSVDGTALNVRAETSGTVGSVEFSYDGAYVRTENLTPYAFALDDNGAYRKWTPTVGTHRMKARAFTKSNRGGTAGAALELTLNVVSSAPTGGDSGTKEPAPPTTGSSISQVVLINADSQKILRPLANHDVISLSSDGLSLNLRADVSGKVGSVAFYLDGKLVRTESVAPYAFAADDNGKYYKWTPPLGSHTLRVVPYEKGGATGTAGQAREIAFSVVSGTVVSPPPAPKPTPEPEPDVTPDPVPPSKGALSLYKSDGSLDLSLYGLLALSYDKATMEMRLGPSFLDLNPNAPDDRPTLYKPASYKRTSGYIRTNPYELGGPPVTDGDYWSESGQVAYVPDDISDPGLDRVQVYAYYDRVFAISPRLDWASGKPHPDPQTREPYYTTLFGEAPKYPVAMARNYGMQCNEALVLYRDGYLGVAATQTSRNGSERPYPGFVFPETKVPTGIAITTGNEFALVTVWDIAAKKGQLAVFALEAKYLPFHTWPYMGLPNQGSWSAFKLLGYVDLPMKMPTSVSAASNGWWSGPSQTGGKVLSQINLANDSDRKNVYSGAWNGVVATKGYAMVASKYDNTVAIVDLSPLFGYMRDSYLSSATSYKNTLAARGTGANDFPQAFSAKPSITPQVVWQSSVAEPTTVLAGFRVDRWTRDHYKGYVASADGTISIIDTSSLLKRYDWERSGSIRKVGSFNVGRNPVSMAFTRRGDSNLPLLPKLSDGSQSRADPLNNIFYIAVRGERKVVAAVTFNGQGAVYRTIKDKRMGDPVAVSTAIRGPILSVADFRGKKMISFRVGKITDLRNNKVYGCGADGNDPFEYAGDTPFAGHPFLLNTTNVN